MGHLLKLLATSLSLGGIAGMLQSAPAGPSMRQTEGPPAERKPPLSQDDLKKLPQTPGSVGDQERHYFFAEAGVESPYRLYVPKGWSSESRMPLVVILHGHGGHHDGPFDGAPPGDKDIVQRLAEAHGFIVVSPEGFGKTDFGNEVPMPFKQKFQGDPKDPATAEKSERENQLSEKDVLHVVALVAKEYKTDQKRLFLMGNSGGSMGTFSLAAKYPEMWAAISPSDGPIEPTLYHAERLKGLKGARVIQAENDTMASADAMRELAEKIKAQGVPTAFQIAAGAVHATGWYVELPRTFDFFAACSFR